MLKVTLGDNTFSVDYVSALALREIGQPMAILKKLDGKEAPEDFGKDLDVLVRWFCVLFRSQFTPDAVYENYPADRLLPDLALAVMAVQQQISSALSAFPTKADGTKATGSP